MTEPALGKLGSLGKALLAAAAMALPAAPALAQTFGNMEQRFFAEQDDPVHPGFAKHGMRTDLLMVTAAYMSASPTLDWMAFTEMSDAAIERSLLAYREDRLKWTVEEANAYTGYVVLDIEGDAVPSHWKFIRDEVATYDPSMADYDRFLDAYERRIDHVRALFPNAKIGVWNPVKAPLNGNAPTSFTTRVDAVVDAARDHGVFDNVDVLCPRLYPGWAPTDFDGNLDRVHRNYRRTAGHTLEQSQRIRRSDGSEMNVFPILSVLIINDCRANSTVGYTCSTKHGKHVIEPDVDPELDDTIAVFIDEIREPTLNDGDPGRANPRPAEGYAFWVSDEIFGIRSLMSDSKPTPDDYWDRLYCRGDYDADGQLTISDVIGFLDFYTTGDRVVDWNLDEKTDFDDLMGFLNAMVAGCQN